MARAVDHQAAARAGVHVPRDHDQPPVYDGDTALFPKGWDDMDPDRHRAEFCYPTWGEVARSWGHLRVRCLDCKQYVIASTRAELDLLMAEHVGEKS